MTKEQELMAFLHERVFDPILASPQASESLKKGVRYTIMRMNRLSAASMRQYYWSAVGGTERSAEFARHMREERFTRFEECADEFRDRFDDNWLRA